VPWTVAAGDGFGLESLCQIYDQNEDPYDANNAPLGAVPQTIFACPQANEIRILPNNWIAGNYAGNIEVLDRCYSVSKCTDGASQTILATEIASDRGLAYITGP